MVTAPFKKVDVWEVSLLGYGECNMENQFSIGIIDWER